MNPESVETGSLLAADPFYRARQEYPPRPGFLRCG